MLKKIVLFFILFSLVPAKNISQEIPPINIYTTEDYGAENQNWSITQSDSKFIYVANNEGLLEFNGAKWSLYPTPNETIMRSVYYFDNRVFSGFYMDFGFWTKDNFGLLQYTSLVKTNQIEMLEDEQIWEIVELDGWVLFKSFQRIYMYNLQTKSVKIINADKTIVKLSKVDGTLYFQELGKGIFKIENGTRNLISDDIILRENRVVEMFSKNGKIYILTQKKGFYFLDNSLLKPWESSSKEFLKTKTIYSAKKLANNDFVLGTISNGLIYLNQNGALDYQITQSLGLSNNTILSVFEDMNNNLWLGLDNGINTINLTSPFKLYAKQDNFWGTVYASIVYNNKLYLGTNQGLYSKELNNNNSDFTFVENTEGQVWNLQNIDGSLFCSHDSGTFVISENGVITVQNATGAWGINKINDDTLLQGSYDGLHVLKKNNGVWILRNKIQGFSNSSRYFLNLEDNRVFVNHEYKGVFKLKLSKDLTKVTEVIKDNSVEKGIHSSLVKYNNHILYSCKKGVYKYNKQADTFTLDSVFSRLMPEEKFLSAKLIKDNKTNKLWSFTKDDIRFLTPGKLSNEPKIKIIPITGAIHKGASGYENIINLKDKEYLIGTSSGYILVDLDMIKEPVSFEVYVNKIYNFKLDNKETLVNVKKDTTFNYQFNNISFHYSVPNYTKTSSIKYQYILEGFNEKWSNKNTANTILFENLAPDDYVFKVKSFIDDKESENIASFAFRIENPWYLSPLFKFIYISILIAFIFIAHYFTRRYYKKQREKLLERNQKELELKELENSQKIIKLNNDKLRSDIENKNRELATSTMSIIKKNEFLNTIKNELVSGGKSNVDSVIRIINKNLNNTDDWKMFQEAFNNADKNFIKKVKTIHPQLTPNDLRLCAYLRLNLSSKEIAPLLNISPRSVEVKRYRLRKKMNLEHDENLTEYIISI